MTVTVTHSAVVVVPDDGTSPVGTDEWNAAHVVTGVRELLDANRTYYVRTDGSDSNDGLANTAGGAWATIQHAIDVVAETLDFTSGYRVNIQVADGTYDEKPRMKPLLGGGVRNNFYADAPTNPGMCSIVGNSADITAVTIKPTFWSSPDEEEVIGAYSVPWGWEFWYITIDGTSPAHSGGHLVQLDKAELDFQHCKFIMGGGFVWFVMAMWWNSHMRINFPTFSVPDGQQLDALFNLDLNSTLFTYNNFTLSPAATGYSFVHGLFDADQQCAIYLNGTNFVGWGSPVQIPYYLARGSGITRLAGSGAVPGTLPGEVDLSSYYSPQFGETYSGDYYFYQPNIRTKIAADTTFYVRPDGNDSNTGLANTAGGAWLTIQHAIDYVAAEIDLGHNWTVTIQLADGVYDEQLLLKPVVGLGGHFGTVDTAEAGQVFILGNSTTHSSTKIKSTSTGFENALVYAENVNGWEFWYCAFDGTDTTFAGGSADYLVRLRNSNTSFVECDFSIDGSTNKKIVLDLIESRGRLNDLNFNATGTLDSIIRLNRRSSPYSTGAMTLLTGTPVMTNGFYNVDNSTFRLESVSYTGWGSISCVPYTLSESANLNTIFTSGFPGTLLPYIDTTSAFNSRHGWISPLETQAVSGSIGFKQNTTTSNAEIGSSIHSVATDATGGSEDFYLSFRNMNAGAAAAELMRLEKTATAGDTALMLYDTDNNTVERVSVGIADSGGAGFKVLRIPN